MSDPGFIFRQPDDAPYVVLWKRGRCQEIGHFTLAEALILQRDLEQAIAYLKALHVSFGEDA